MARPELGVKRQCMNCGAKFYDLDRDPATCPKCGTIYQVATSRVAPPIASRSDDDEEEDEKTGPETVSLDEAEATEDDADISVDDDESGDDAGGSTDDDTFLEEEDGDDDVSDLIDNDSDNDEEG